jgi:hypothetical protein
MRSGFVEEGDERHMQLRKVIPARAQKGYRNDGDGADRLHQALHERQLLQASDMMHATLMLMSSVVGVPLPKMQQSRQRERRWPSHSFLGILLLPPINSQNARSDLPNRRSDLQKRLGRDRARTWPAAAAPGPTAYHRPTRFVSSDSTLIIIILYYIGLCSTSTHEGEGQHGLWHTYYTALGVSQTVAGINIFS